VTQISNLSIVHLQKNYIPEVTKEDEATIPGLNILDRMVALCQLTEARQDFFQPKVPSESPILETEEI